MLIKLRQQLDIPNRTPANRTPNLRSREFIINYLRQQRLIKSSSGLRASIGLARWMIDQANFVENRIASRAECFITGRSRGTSKRFTVARTKIKFLAGEAKLFGLRKASW